MNIQLSIKRFIFGGIVGIFVAIIVWSYSAFFHVAIPLSQGIVGTFILTISCGMVAAIGNINKLMDNLPFL